MPDAHADDEPVIRWEQDADGVVTLTMDDPQQTVNTLNDRFTAALARCVQRLEDEQPTVRGVVLRSGKRSFLAGGDLRRLVAIDASARDAFLCDLELRKSRTRRLERFPFPVVAVLDGPAMGGGLELALSCHRRIAVDDPRVLVGLPEVTLGLLPGGGGVVRLTALLGPGAAMPLLLSGRRLTAAEAAGLGIVDELTAGTEDAIARARAWILATPVGEVAQPWDRGADATAGPPAAVVPDSNPARARIRRLVADAPRLTVEERLTAESEGLADLVVTAEAKATIQVVFFDSVLLRNRYRAAHVAQVRPLALAVPAGHPGIQAPVAVIPAAEADAHDGVVADAVVEKVPAERTRPAVAVSADRIGDGGTVAEVWPGGTTTPEVLAGLAAAGVLPLLRGAGDRPLADEVRDRAVAAAASEPSGAAALAWLGFGAPVSPDDGDPGETAAAALRLLDRVAADLAGAGLLACAEDLDVSSVRAGGFPPWTGGAARRAATAAVAG
ncbi:enoyl-CoA hydratase/isomerase family protein [Blastococcus sp. SYSU DS0533]